MLKEKLYSEYQKHYKDYKDKQKEVEEFKTVVEQLKLDGFHEKIKLNNDKKVTLEEIANRKQHLSDIINGRDGSTVIKNFDENQLRLQLSKNKKKEIAKLSSKYDSSISNIKNSLQNLDSEYKNILKREISYVDNNSQLCNLFDGLNNKMSNNELPQVILSTLSESVDSVVQRKNINGGEKVAQIASKVSPLDNLRKYTPNWLIIFVNIGFPVIVGIGLLLFFFFSGAHLEFVSNTTNAIATFLFRVLCVVIGFGIGFVILGVISKGKVAVAVIGGIIGGIIGLSISANLSVKLPYGFTNAIEWIVKTIICVAVGIGLYCLNTNTDVGNALVNVGMKLSFVKKSALAKQGCMIQKNADSYYVLLKYREIINYIVENDKQNQSNYLNSELTRLQSEKESAVATLDTKLNKEIERKIVSEKVAADESKKLLVKLQHDIEECDKEYLVKSAEFDQKIDKSEKNFNKKINEVLVEITKKNSEFESDLKVIHDIFDRINNNTVGFDESKGVLSNYIYLFNENSSDDPKSLVSIKHDKKPIVFLYDIEDSTNISAALFEFMKAVLAGFLTINANDAFDVIVTDPVSKARKFEQMTRFLSIENDIKKLSYMIQNSMRNVAKEGIHIDDHNRKMNKDGEDKVKYFKYKIVEFIVPEEAAAQNTNFFDSDLWGTLGDGKENGFIPIFYINYSDWKNTFDNDSKLNSKFILQLKNAIGSSNGSVYKIDPENITIEKVN